MNPRLTVTREQAERVLEWRGPGGRHTVPVPERPTMPCPVCLGYGRRWRNGRPDGLPCTACPDDYLPPIPEGERVDVGWESAVFWHHVATATLADVELRDCDIEPWTYRMTLTDVEAPDA